MTNKNSEQKYIIRLGQRPGKPLGTVENTMKSGVKCDGSEKAGHIGSERT